MRVGVDAQPIGEVADAMSSHGDRYLNRLFTEQEIAACGGREGRVAAASLAARFAAKEATLKALRVTDRVPGWQEIEVVSEQSGPVGLRLSGLAGELAAEAGLTEFEVSLTHASDLAIAVVIAA
ncbi:holo-ACP synthase [Humibacter ginsengisoli]